MNAGNVSARRVEAAVAGGARIQTGHSPQSKPSDGSDEPAEDGLPTALAANGTPPTVFSARNFDD